MAAALLKQSQKYTLTELKLLSGAAADKKMIIIKPAQTSHVHNKSFEEDKVWWGDITSYHKIPQREARFDRIDFQIANQGGGGAHSVGCHSSENRCWRVD